MADTLIYNFNLAVWTQPEDQDLVLAIKETCQASLSITAVGNTSASSISELASNLNLKPNNDLRTLILESDANILLLTHCEGLSFEHLQLAHQQGIIIATTQPLAQQIEDLPDSDTPIIFLPTFLESQGWLSASSPMQVLEKPKLIHVNQISTSKNATLFANLYDAWQILSQIASPPQSISASLTGPLTHTPENLYAITGHIALHANLPDGQSFTINASDSAGLPLRSLRAISDNADLSVWENNYRINDTQGGTIEASENFESSKDYKDLVADAFKRALTRIQAHNSAQNATISNIETEKQDTILACCQATLLSARTNQPESPNMFLKMIR